MSKYNTILLALGLGFGIIAHGQVAKKPSIMVVPSDNWCTQNNFMQSYEVYGTTMSVPITGKPRKQLDLLLVISTINKMFMTVDFLEGP